MAELIVIDDKSPKDIAQSFSDVVGVVKANASIKALIVLGLLAGAYIGFGGLLSCVVTFDFASVAGLGFKKLIAGSAFTIGLILVVVAGAELFTGNNLIIMSVLSKKVSYGELMRNWSVVYMANFVGALLIAMLFYLSGLWKTSGNDLGIAAIKIANSKVNISFIEAFVRAIGCNWMVCLAVWMASGARNITGKIVAIFFPIMGFVAIGFEHCVANMYFIPSALFLKQWTNIIPVGLDLSNLNWSAFFIKNLLPVTIGNIVGGTIFVGLAYWYSYIGLSKK